jgi:hypothetical protein
MARFEPETLKKIDKNFLIHPKNIFIYPTNFYRTEFDNPHFEHLSGWSNGWGFLVTKKPSKYQDRFYLKEEYTSIFKTYMAILIPVVLRAEKMNKDIYIFHMGEDPILWAEIIKPEMEKAFENKNNVIFLWEK